MSYRFFKIEDVDFNDLVEYIDDILDEEFEDWEVLAIINGYLHRSTKFCHYYKSDLENIFNIIKELISVNTTKGSP